MTVRLIELVENVETPLVGTFPTETEAAAEARKRQRVAIASGTRPTDRKFPRFRIVSADS